MIAYSQEILNSCIVFFAMRAWRSGADVYSPAHVEVCGRSSVGGAARIVG